MMLFSNVPEAVYLQHLMGVEGVIVDFVEQITEAVSNLMRPSKVRASSSAGGGEGEEEEILLEGEEQIQLPQESRPQFSERELSFLLKLIPELIEQQ